MQGFFNVENIKHLYDSQWWHLIVLTSRPVIDDTSKAVLKSHKLKPPKMASYGLVEVDSLQVKVIVDNEIDPISPTNNPAVQYTGLMQGVPLAPLKDAASHDRGDAIAELRMDHICCGAHGLSLMIVCHDFLPPSLPRPT